MARQTAHIKSGGGTPEIEIRFGNANVGAYRVFLWEAGRDPKQIGDTAQGRVSLESPGKLAIARVSYEAIIQSPEPGVNQPYSISVQIYQDGRAVPGSSYLERGRLNPDGAKSVIGFIAFEVS